MAIQTMTLSYLPGSQLLRVPNSPKTFNRNHYQTTRPNHSLAKRVKGRPTRPSLTLELRMKVQKITTNNLGMVMITLNHLKTRNVKVKTGLLAGPITTHTDPEVAKVNNATVH